MTTQAHVLLAVEAEAFVEHLEEFALPDTGSSRFVEANNFLEFIFGSISLSLVQT